MPTYACYLGTLSTDRVKMQIVAPIQLSVEPLSRRNTDGIVDVGQITEGGRPVQNHQHVDRPSSFSGFMTGYHRILH